MCTRFPRKVPDFLRYTALLRLPVGFLLIKMPDFRAARGLGHPGRRLYRKGRESFMQKVSVCSMAKRTRRVLWMGIPAGCRLLAAAIPLYLWQGEDEALESRHLDGGGNRERPLPCQMAGAFRKNGRVNRAGAGHARCCPRIPQWRGRRRRRRCRRCSSTPWRPICPGRGRLPRRRCARQ